MSLVCQSIEKSLLFVLSSSDTEVAVIAVYSSQAADLTASTAQRWILALVAVNHWRQSLLCDSSCFLRERETGTCAETASLRSRVVRRWSRGVEVKLRRVASSTWGERRELWGA